MPDHLQPHIRQPLTHLLTICAIRRTFPPIPIAIGLLPRRRNVRILLSTVDDPLLLPPHPPHYGRPSADRCLFNFLSGGGFIITSYALCSSLRRTVAKSLGVVRLLASAWRNCSVLVSRLISRSDAAVGKRTGPDRRRPFDIDPSARVACRG
jgi:hypothetical protein